MEWHQQFATAGDGIRLGYRIYDPAGPSTADPVVCLPGLTRNARDFHEIAGLIAHDTAKPRRIIAIDYRGRGTSEWADDKASYTVGMEVQDLLMVLDACGIDRAAFIGTSRGGLILHVLADLAPAKMSAVILNDIGPDLAVEGLAQIQDYLRAPDRPATWRQAVATLKQVHGPAFPLLTDDDWAAFARAIYRESGGQLAADCDPAIGETFAALDLSQPLPSLWTQFDQFPQAPMMVIRGENSTLLTPETVERMREKRPALLCLTAQGQGHAPLLHLGGLHRQILDFLRDAD
jgi:pimeloyl-ACP methyl ester carboxylesterase